MKQIALFLFTAFLITACSNQTNDEVITSEIEDTTIVNSTLEISNLMDLKIIEGVGLGDVITLGMSREEIIAIATGVDCASDNQCSFRLSPETGTITVHFANDVVDLIEIGQFGVFPEYLWETSKGVTSQTLPSEVAEIYEGSEIETYTTHTNIIALDYGYTFASYLRYGDGSSQRVVTHQVYAVGGRPEVTYRNFQGFIEIINTKRKSTQYDVQITITTPDPGKEAVEVFLPSVDVPGQSSIKLDPESYLPLDGSLGTYYYTVDLLIAKGRKSSVASTYTGSFKLVEFIE
ncbi:hypothetical protein [Aestuariibaculum suncheonense]|uniref:Uncharacterized protein n=1 Tax=Aestuariibaculum suncheonense TaxID=1028745 RepID=A0A8J6QGQ1_9FLAO|nr:hypothetical protein [Aestuariibaculum suncheonense]MBD0836225.1 hypothetical protein [Aestuariibaculum suncheonense]